MSGLHLVVGNKNYSSWSMRPWIALSMAGLPFEETVIPLDQPDTKARIAKHSAAMRVPVLQHGDITVWESLAILEYLAEAFPEKQLWPEETAARAMARAISSEMHAGFTALRNACPMNMRRTPAPVPLGDDVKSNIARIEEMWRACLKASGGPFLFGRFGNADAMYAPVVSRFTTYAVPVSAETHAYMSAMTRCAGFDQWRAGALKETWIIPADEVD